MLGVHASAQLWGMPLTSLQGSCHLCVFAAQFWASVSLDALGMTSSLPMHPWCVLRWGASWHAPTLQDPMGRSGPAQSGRHWLASFNLGHECEMRKDRWCGGRNLL